MLEDVDIGDMQSSCGLKDVGVAIRTVQMELDKLVDRVRVATQQ